MAKSTEKLRHLEESYRYWYITSINDAQYSVHAIGEKKLPTTTWYLVLQYDTYTRRTLISQLRTHPLFVSVIHNLYSVTPHAAHSSNSQ